MLIIFLGSEHSLIEKYIIQDESNASAIIVAQEGVYHLSKIIEQYVNRSKIYVLNRDLKATGLLSSFDDKDNIEIIDFNKFVILSTEFTPSVTIQ
ncbi:DsrH/TusB family sulfur metabolism protein [Glaciecola sp. MF2-115]|uniref:DsrH/TusB family sulfur metabolism protein n=1 Tax=Glaciecola sp. MF2-115 TaxID=3384827 RepID=UPI00399FC994